jgi:chromosome segregation ATPase
VYWENQYKQLRIQFDEKSQVLSVARKELFTLENELLVLKSQQSDLAHVENQEQIQLISHLQNLDEECTDLQQQVDLLQEIVSSLQEKKKATRSKSSKSSSAMDKLLEESSKKMEESLLT